MLKKKRTQEKTEMTDRKKAGPQKNESHILWKTRYLCYNTLTILQAEQEEALI